MYENSVIEYIKNKLHLIKLNDVLSFLFVLPALPYALFLRIKHHEIWIVREKEAQARDNGYVFFIRNINNNKHVELYYAIDKKSNDYQKIKQYEPNILQFGSFKHWAYYLASSACVSSVKRNAPAALPNLVFRKMGLMKKSYFLGHGITKDNAEWLHYKNTKFRLFFCGAKPEYEYVKEHYGYPDGYVAYSGGLCRYDLLHDTQKNSDIILVMPTWRIWLAPGDPRMLKIEKTKRFTETEFYAAWMKFLNSEEVYKILCEQNCRMVFFLHPLFQSYTSLFHTNNPRMEIVSENNTDLQKLIKSARMLITDYSSVYFDFIYQKKPVIFYQFDKEKYRANHYAEGWFDYCNNRFGKSLLNIDDLEIELREICKRDYVVGKTYEEEHRNLFPVFDAQNSNRSFEFVYNTLHNKS